MIELTRCRVDMTNPKKTVVTPTKRITFRVDSITAVEEESFATKVWAGSTFYYVTEPYEYIVERIKSLRQ